MTRAVFCADHARSYLEPVGSPAEQMAESPGRAPFPALDPEPPPQPWPRRLRWPAAVITAAALGWAGFSFWPSPGSGGHTGAGAHSDRAAATGRSGVTARGRVLAETSTGGLVLADPDGTNRARLPGLGVMPRGRLPAASPDGRYLVTPGGSLYTLTGAAKPVLARKGLAVTATTMPVPVSPFSDHGRALVMRNTRIASSAVPTTVVTVADGSTVSLRSWNFAAGDPKAPGAFVVEAVPPGGLAAGTFLRMPDRRLELLDVGHKPVVLATARKLNTILGVPAGRLDTIFAFPSPSGDRVAAEVRPARSQKAEPVSGIVVLSRTGRVIDSVPQDVGALSAPVWSHTGRALAFVTASTIGPALNIWGIGSGNLVRDFPYDGAAYRRCVWSPDGTQILCSDARGRHWAVAQVTGGQMAAVPGRGVPVTWLP